MLYVACGKLVVTRLKESWPEDLALLLAAYDKRVGSSEQSSSASEQQQGWSVSDLLKSHQLEFPQATELLTRLPSQLTAIITSCLAVDPTARPSVADLLISADYITLLAARDEAAAPCAKEHQATNMNTIEQVEGQAQVLALTQQLAEKQERMEILETILAEERAGHHRTATLLEEESAKLLAANEKIAELEKDTDDEDDEEGKVAAVAIVGQHHPGFYNGELNEWMCCMGSGRLPPGCQEGVTMHHPGYYGKP
jgi:hypothetical protein